jgi:hypothetical protein
MSDSNGFTGTPAEVSAIKQHRGLLANLTDPSLQRMVVGPEAAMDGKKNPGADAYSQAARQWLEQTPVNSWSGQGFVNPKDSSDSFKQAMQEQGWSLYNQLTNALQVQAQKMGLKSYEDSPVLTQIKKDGVQYIAQQNWAWGDQWNAFALDESKYNGLIAGMRQIVKNKSLANNPSRRDVYWLGQYLTLRDQINAILKQRGAEGGNVTIGAKSNRDLAIAYSAGVDYLRQQNTYFDDYMYNGTIEKDPMLAQARRNNG